MRRSWIAGLALLTAACGTATETYNCSPCAGPTLSITGVPDAVGRVALRVCMAEQPCATSHEAIRTGIPTSVSVPLSTDAVWEDYDRRTVTVSARSHLGHWHGSGAFHYTAGGGGPCSCPALFVQVRLGRVTPRG